MHGNVAYEFVWLGSTHDHFAYSFSRPCHNGALTGKAVEGVSSVSGRAYVNLQHPVDRELIVPSLWKNVVWVSEFGAACGKSQLLTLPPTIASPVEEGLNRVRRSIISPKTCNMTSPAMPFDFNGVPDVNLMFDEGGGSKSKTSFVPV